MQWSGSYSYDGFGNLTSKADGGPPVLPQVDPTTNQARMTGDYGFDANGNWLGTSGNMGHLPNTWNMENQLLSNGSPDSSGNPQTYTYDPWGKRVLQYSTSGTLYFYSITGQRLGIYRIPNVISVPAVQSVNMYFGGRMLVAMDRLGSVRNGNGQSIAYYPWGEERTTTPDGADKFATYFRDISPGSGVGEDYANARYYNSNFGRFWSPDPFRHAKLGRPQSWNQYAYVSGDPVNFNDAGGEGECAVGQPIPCTDYVTGFGNDTSDPTDEDFDFGGPFGPCIFSVMTLGCNTDTGPQPAGPKQRADALIYMGRGMVLLKRFSTSSQKCLTDLNKFGLDPSAVATIAQQTKLVDVSTLPPSGQSNFDPGMDMTAVVNPNTGADFIVYNQNNFWQGTASQIDGTLLHEIIHLNNMTQNTDQQIAAALGVTVTKTDTSAISIKLANDCFPDQ